MEFDLAITGIQLCDVANSALTSLSDLHTFCIHFVYFIVLHICCILCIFVAYLLHMFCTFAYFNFFSPFFLHMFCITVLCLHELVFIIMMDIQAVRCSCAVLSVNIHINMHNMHNMHNMLQIEFLLFMQDMIMISKFFGRRLTQSSPKTFLCDTDCGSIV